MADRQIDRLADTQKERERGREGERERERNERVRSAIIHASQL